MPLDLLEDKESFPLVYPGCHQALASKLFHSKMKVQNVHQEQHPGRLILKARLTQQFQINNLIKPSTYSKRTFLLKKKKKL